MHPLREISPDVGSFPTLALTPISLRRPTSPVDCVKQMLSRQQTALEHVPARDLRTSQHALPLHQMTSRQVETILLGAVYDGLIAGHLQTSRRLNTSKVQRQGLT